MAKSFVVRKAEASDAEFLSLGAREAERCNCGIGIYDVLVGKSAEDISKMDRTASDEVSAYIKHCVLNDPASHAYYENFLVVVEEGTGQLAASACIYPYPEFGLSKSIPGLKIALKEVLGYTAEQIDEALDRWSFLDSSFPDVEFNNTWMVEAVYVDPNYRKHGLGERLLRACMEGIAKKYEGVESRRYLITCAVGNEPARRLYERLGFTLAGQGESEECMKAINCSGFYVLTKEAPGL
jgi:ribosomal protein S18 acetylase RimI-like enzyme